jgi:hypothetical protein
VVRALLIELLETSDTSGQRVVAPTLPIVDTDWNQPGGLAIETVGGCEEIRNGWI